MRRLLSFWTRAAGPFTMSPLAAIAVALALLVAGVALGLHNETLSRTEKIQQARVQARILAASLSAPLAFDDRAAANEFLGALRFDDEVRAAGAYGADGRLVAGFGRAGAALPATNRPGAPRFEGNDLVVTVPVEQNGALLGSVHLRTATESWTRRGVRYLGIALIVVMACLLVAVLGSSYASLSEAHRALQKEIEGRRKAEEQLRRAQKMEAMGQLTGGVAHDFNNLLMVASSGLDLLERTEDPVKRARLKQGIRQAVERGAKLTQQLLTFARRSPMHPEVIDVAARLRDMDTLLDRSLREDIVVRFDLPDGLWPVEVDPSQLEVGILNIALNARDAMPEGGTIAIAAANRPGALPDGGDAVELSIGDTGAGLPAEMIEKVFEPFFTTKPVGQGTGLGLSQVYGFARASGGEVRFESEVGRGTTMSLLIPRSRAGHSEAPAAARIDERAAGRGTALLVEDDAAVAELVEAMLVELGFGVERTGSADAALELLRRPRRFDLILSDMVMPGEVGGLELARRIARDGPATPVILMTGYSEAAAAAAAEGIRLLLKPYRIDDLAREIEAATGS